MIKRLGVIILVFIIAGNYSCERDDLCPESTQTTAKLVMQAVNASDSEESKNIFNLRIEGLDDDGNGLGVLEGYNVVTTNDVILPLRTDADVTKYKLHRDYTEDDDGNPNGGNEDIITITYTREDVFVSRACGFKTVFNNVQIRVDVDDVDVDEWIQFIQAENDDNQTVDNEEQVHFLLLH